MQVIPLNRLVSRFNGELNTATFCLTYLLIKRGLQTQFPENILLE